jgi:hypothetical protein
MRVLPGILQDNRVRGNKIMDHDDFRFSRQYPFVFGNGFLVTLRFVQRGREIRARRVIFRSKLHDLCAECVPPLETDVPGPALPHNRARIQELQVEAQTLCDRTRVSARDRLCGTKRRDDRAALHLRGFFSSSFSSALRADGGSSLFALRSLPEFRLRRRRRSPSACFTSSPADFATASASSALPACCSASASRDATAIIAGFNFAAALRSVIASSKFFSSVKRSARSRSAATFSGSSAST